MIRTLDLLNWPQQVMVIKSLHFLVGITLSLAYKITQTYKNWQRHTLAPLAFQDGPHSTYWSVYLPAQTFFHLEKKKFSIFSGLQYDGEVQLWIHVWTCFISCKILSIQNIIMGYLQITNFEEIFAEYHLTSFLCLIKSFIMSWCFWGIILNFSFYCHRLDF